MTFDKKILVFIVFISVLFISGCGWNYKNELDAPQIPVFKTFDLNIESLDSNNVPANIKSYDLNWYVAYSKVLFWKQFIGDYVSTPFLALNQCYLAEPKYFADNTWVRETEVIYDSQTYYISLYGTFMSDSSVNWEMYYSTNRQNSFLLLTGYQNNEMTIGSWTFYQYIFSPVEVLKINWIQTDSSFNVSYINILENNIYLGSHLDLYYLNQNSENERLNLFVDFYNSFENNTTYVQLDSMTYYGRIKDSLIYFNNEWHYWGQ